MKLYFFAPILGAALFAGCATTQAPPELVQARAAYARANSGAASRLAMVDLHNARTDLEHAEQSFRDAPGDEVTRDLSYVAQRHAQTAEARGETLESEALGAHAEQERNALTGQRLTQTQNALQQSQAAQTQTAAQLATEHAARVEAERQASAALASLRQIAAVREDQRGMVITLSGEVLFATGQSSLLPIALDRLNQVAQALHDQGARRLRVEGYTDSRGAPASNQALSLARANSVRSHLITRGISADQIEAAGLGPERPVADNATAEGRANNRRVEIVVSPASPAPTPVAMGATSAR